jgi:hypothetical protein
LFMNVFVPDFICLMNKKKKAKFFFKKVNLSDLTTSTMKITKI